MKYFMLYLLIFCGSAFAKNPVFPGWYGDPGGAVLDNKYWIFSGPSTHDTEQTYFDAFSSSDMINWKKHPRVLEAKDVKWADNSFWSPSPFQHNGKYYVAFGAAKMFLENKLQGIGIAVADKPEGPYRDLSDYAMIGVKYGEDPRFPSVFIDKDSQIYMLYGHQDKKGYMVKLSMNLTKSIVPFEDGSKIKEVSPEGSCISHVLFERNGVYYLLCSKDSGTEFSTSKSAVGPFSKGRTIMTEHMSFKNRAHGVIKAINQDKYFLVYHRSPKNWMRKVVCVEDINFDGNGDILKIRPTDQGAFNDKPMHGSAFLAVIDYTLILFVAAMHFAPV